MNDCYEHIFADSVFGGRLTVAVPQSYNFSREKVWLDFVARRYATSDLAWLAYCAEMPHRGRIFASSEQSLFDVVYERLCESTLPDYGTATFTKFTVDQLQKQQASARLADKRHGAKQVQQQVQSVLHEVTPKLDSISFVSQAALNAFRMALHEPVSQQPAAAAAAAAPPAADEAKRKPRRRKRRLFGGVTMPVPPSIPKLREQRAQELQARADIKYIVADEQNNMRTLPAPPVDDRALVGLVFDVRAQFRRALELDRIAGELVEITGDGEEAKAQELELEVVMGEDGVCPHKQSLLCVVLRVLDPGCRVFRSGVSRTLHVLMAWLPESGIRDVAAIRNRALSDFLNDRYTRSSRCYSI